MGARVFIDGQAGTTGLGIAARLAGLGAVRLITLEDSQRKLAAARREAMAAADLVVLCLPDEAAREAVGLAESLGQAAPKLLDASTAHRVAPGWAYGFAELCAGQAGRIAGARRVANPGCYATGAIALLRPLVAGGVIAPDAPLGIHAVSGYSGGGKAMIAAYEEHPEGGPAFALYGLDLAHKHIPEIMAHAGLARAPIFVPAVARIRQGMLVSIPVHVDALAGRARLAGLSAALADWYAGAEQVRVVAGAGRMEIGAPADGDAMELSVALSRDGSQAVLLARLDNLGKGASGAAVQNARLMLGLA